ncbi:MULTISPECIES: hypothetical protein [Asticcacaulis]|uniref:hypothetical protein n=1 Tax=Asticcacaulis TaxID=76890 RepID=UPI001AE8E6E1|nr:MULTISPECIES: hypothetical protein [Asticcacaulis]MBP2158365.1 hypothetical protein [Asticcacaulis solisilvae]MDR6799410.1 hypothetical protein [Asticcacaulis sp. BE141]
MRGIWAGCLGSILGLMCVAGIAVAADRPIPPPIPPVDALSAPPVTARFAKSFRIGDLDGAFSQIGLGDMKKALGAGAVAGIQGMSWLCYDLPAAKQRVWLSSTGGAMETVTVTRIGAPSASCPALPAKNQAVVVDGGIRIGMARAELTKRLGQPSRQIDTWTVYSAQQAAGRQGLAVQFINDKAAFIAITHLDR